MDIEFLITLLKVQTVSGDEGYMRTFITNYLEKTFGNNISYEVDNYGNILVTKGSTEWFPCVVAHMDTVHNILPDGEEINIGYNHIENSLYGINSVTNEPTGIGGDDKCGIYVCIEALKTFENIKIAIFVEEETGCWGSKNAKEDFFNDVGYFIQFDAPFDNWISHYLSNKKLFHEDGEFFKIIKKSLRIFMPHYQLLKNSYTDVLPMKERFNKQAINFSIGYHDMHSPNEFIKLDEMGRLKQMGMLIIDNLGEKNYPFNI